MNDMTPNKKRGSLIERAAEAYDLTRYLRPSEVVIDVPADRTAPGTRGACWRAGHLGECGCARHRAAGRRARVFPVEPREGAVAIDRKTLSDNGLLVPDAPVGPLAEEFRLIKRQLLTHRQGGRRDSAEQGAHDPCLLAQAGRRQNLSARSTSPSRWRRSATSRCC